MMFYLYIYLIELGHAAPYLLLTTIIGTLWWVTVAGMIAESAEDVSEKDAKWIRYVLKKD